jgi:NAD(P)-dependent dehydrogenase (short-subunit alcohol dehydrogenase family)
LGRAIAIAFARAGAKVGLLSRSREGLESARADIGGGETAVCDVADAAALADAAEKLAQALGGLDIWVNNAMETVFSRVGDITPDEFKRVTEVDYLGCVYGTQEALKRLKPGGQIIQVGSALAYRSIPLQSAYCAAKAAMRGFTDALRCELLHDKRDIALTMVHMPALNTPQFSWARTHIPHQPQPVGTIFQPELGAQAVVHAARWPRREYWVGGSTVAAIIGTKFFPGWMDAKMARLCYEQQWVQGSHLAPRDGNLFAPAPAGLHTTRGQFSDKATLHSPTWKLTALAGRLLSYLNL